MKSPPVEIPTGTTFAAFSLRETTRSSFRLDYKIAHALGEERLREAVKVPGAVQSRLIPRYKPLIVEPKFAHRRIVQERGVSRGGGARPLPIKPERWFPSLSGSQDYVCSTDMLGLRGVSLCQKVEPSEKEIRVLNHSAKTERNPRPVSWGGNKKGDSSLPNATRKLANRAADILERKAKVLKLKLERDNTKQWDAFRNSMTGPERVVVDALLQDKEALRAFKVKLGVLQGAVSSVGEFPTERLPPLQARELGIYAEDIARTPVQVLFESITTLIGYELSQYHYEGLVLAIDLLTSTSCAQAIIKLESVALFARRLPKHHVVGASLLHLTSILAQVGLGTAMVFQATTDTFLQTVLDMRESPLTSKLGAAVLAIIPSITAIEVGTLGYSLIGSAIENIKNTVVPHTTALGAVADALDQVIKNITTFTETGDIKDLIGRDSSATWILEANEMIDRLQALRSDFKGKDVRGALRDAQNLYEKGLKSKNAQVGVKVRELESKLRNFKEGLSRHRLPPVAVILKGPPGSGKTVFLERLSNCWKNRLHIDDDVQVMYEFSATTFQSPPSILSILTLNDFMQMKAECAKLKVDPLDLLQKLSDSSPLDLEGASLDLKNFYIQPDFVVVTTNTTAYQFSNSVGGVYKLDRRYFICEFSWTKEMVDFCAAEKRPEYEVYRIGNYKGRVKHPVLYRFGHMMTPTDENNQTINIRVDRLLFETHSLDQVIGYLFTQESHRVESFDKRLPPHQGELCACGLTLGSGCPCDTRPRIVMDPVVQNVQPVEEEHPVGERPPQDEDEVPIQLNHNAALAEEDDDAPLEYNMDRNWGANIAIPVRREFQGATISHSVADESKEFIVEALGRLENATNCLPGAPNGHFDQSMDKHLQKIGLIAPGSFRLDHVLRIDLMSVRPAHLVGGVLALGVFAMVVKKIAYRFSKQGLVHSTGSFPNETKDERPLPPFHATQAPYLKPTPAANTVKISRLSKGIRATMNAVILTKYWLVLPYHFLKAADGVSPIEEGDVIEMTYLDRVFSYTYRKEYLYVPDTKRDRAYLYNPCMHSVSAGVYNALPEKFTVPSERVDMGVFKDMGCYDNNDGFVTYNAPTEPGSCGTPLIGSKTGSVYGFHFVRYYSPIDSYSQAEPLSKTEARKVFEWGNSKGLVSDIHSHILPKVLQQKVDEGTIQPGLHKKSDAWWYHKSDPEAWPEHNHQVIGHFPSCDREKFTVHKTTMHDRFGDRCKEYGNPHGGKAVLQPDGSYGSAVVTRLNVSKNPPFTWNFQIAMRVIESMVDELDLEPTRPLTDYESLCGSPVDVMINSKDTTKSIGPTARLMGLRKENAFVEKAPGEYDVDQMLLDAIAELEREIREDEELKPCYVKAQGKDEAYPKEKADKGKKRFFYISDWPLNHVCRKYILPLISLLIRQPTKSGFFISINAASPAWKAVCDWLSELGINVMDADFSSFDLCHRFILLMYVVYMCMIAEKSQYLSPEVKFMRRLMIKRLWYCLEMEGNFFYVLYQLCSGWMDTIIVNCFAVKFMYTYAYFKRSMELKVIPRPPKEVMRIAAVGDDSVVNMLRAIHHILNPALMQVEAALMGYAMTSGDKSAVMKFTELKDIVFLKRGFIKEGHRVWAPLATDSIYKALSYSTGKMSPTQQRARDESAANSAIREMFLHGKTMYEELCRELKLEFPHAQYPLYEELLLEYDVGMFETWRDIRSQGAVMQYQMQTNVVVSHEVYNLLVRTAVVPLTQEILRRTTYGLATDLVTGASLSASVNPQVGNSFVVAAMISHRFPWWFSLYCHFYCNLYPYYPNAAWMAPARVILSFVKAWGTALTRLMDNIPGAQDLPVWMYIANVLIISPYCEEEAKREGWLGLLFPLLEFMIFTQVVNWRQRLPCLLFHYYTLTLPFRWAVWVHFLWNMMAMEMEGYFREQHFASAVRVVTLPFRVFHEGLVDIIAQQWPPEGGRDVVYQPAQGAALSCPIPGRGAFQDFPVPEHSMQARAHSHGVLNCSTELNSMSQDVLDVTTNATHITSINHDTEVVVGGSAPYAPVSEQGYSAFFGRPREIMRHTTPINTPVFVPLLTTWRNLAPVAPMRNQWGLFRGDPTVTVSYTGNASFNGLVRVYFYPEFSAGFSDYQDPSWPTFGVTDATHVATSNLPHLDLDMSQSCTCSIDLPYILNRPIGNWENDWYVGIKTINPITTASGVTPTSVTISVSVAYHNVKVARVQYQGSVEVSGGVLSKGLSLAASLSKWFPITTPYTKMLEMGSRAAYSLGYSRAISPVEGAMMSRRFGALGYMTGESSFATTLGSDPMQSADMSGKLVPGLQEDSILAICNKWSMLLAGWDRSVFGVNPAYVGWDNGTTISNTNIGAMAIMFERWSGNLQYKLQVVGSPLIRWRLGLVVVPLGVPVPVSFPADGSYVTHIIEIAGSTDYEFEVEYLHGGPFQYVDPVSAPTTQMAKIVAFSLSDPAGPSATVVYPHLNIWVRAGKDFSLSVPSLSHLVKYKQMQGSYEQVEVASLGEKCDSLRMLSKRKCFMCNLSFNPSNGNKFTMPADGFSGLGSVTYSNGNANQVNLNDAYFTFDTYIRQLHQGYTGGTAYTMVSPGDTANWIFGTSDAQFGSTPTFPARVELEGRGGALYFPEFNKVLEIVVPDRSGVTYKGSLWNPFLNPITGKECLVGVNQDTLASGTARYWAIHSSSGDDRAYVMNLNMNRLVKR